MEWGKKKKKNQANKQKILSDCSDGNQGQALPTATVHAHTLVIWVTGPVTPRRKKPDSCCWLLVTLILWEKQEVPQLGSLHSEPWGTHVDDTAGGRREPGLYKLPALFRPLSQCMTLGNHLTFLYLGFSYLPQFSSVAQSCPTLCNPMNPSNPHINVNKWRITANSIQNLANVYERPYLQG